VAQQQQRLHREPVVAGRVVCNGRVAPGRGWRTILPATGAAQAAATAPTATIDLLS